MTESTNRQNLPRIRLPATNQSQHSRTIGTFARELGKAISPSNTIFFKPETKNVTEIRKYATEKNPERKEEYLGFSELTPQRFVTLAEQHAVIQTRTLIRTTNEQSETTPTWQTIEKNMNLNTASITLASEEFQNQLPAIKRIFTTPIPIIHEGKLTTPLQGYDERFKSWLNPDAKNPAEIPKEEAKETINYIFREFAFEKNEEGKLTSLGNQSRTHAIAALITPYLRGLFPKFNNRTPLYFYLGNRPRVGKDYCAAITGLVYEGISIEEPALNTGEPNQGGSEELRKKILGSMLQGRRRMHFSNNKGFINSAMLEGILTSPTFSDRLLGRNENVTVDNEMDFSLSGNLGITYSNDLANRTRFINLFLDIEDTNKRKFDTPHLHQWVLDNRQTILNSLYTLVKTWADAGMPMGTTSFTSFPEWARICGGIMTFHGFGNPCQPSENKEDEGDEETNNMKKLYELIYEKTGEGYFTKKDLHALMLQDEHGDDGWQERHNLFKWIDFTTKPGKIRFSQIWRRNLNRIYSGLKLKEVSAGIDSRFEIYMLKNTNNDLLINKGILFVKPLDFSKTARTLKEVPLVNFIEEPVEGN